MRQYGDLPDGSGRCARCLLAMSTGRRIATTDRRDFGPLPDCPGGKGPGKPSWRLEPLDLTGASLRIDQKSPIERPLTPHKPPTGGTRRLAVSAEALPLMFQKWQCPEVNPAARQLPWCRTTATGPLFFFPKKSTRLHAGNQCLAARGCWCGRIAELALMEKCYRIPWRRRRPGGPGGFTPVKLPGGSARGVADQLPSVRLARLVMRGGISKGQTLELSWCPVCWVRNSGRTLSR